MKSILIIKNIPREDPGLLLGGLKSRSLKYEIIDLCAGEKLPSPQNFSAIVILGGPDSANDGNEKINSELALIKEALKREIPYLGICLGMQMLVKAAGGNVIKCANKEIGFFDPKEETFTVELTEKGKIDPLFENMNPVLNVFHLHGETVELSEKAELLGEGKICKNQIVRVGKNAYGIQSHFELAAEMLERWLEEDPDLKKLEKRRTLNHFKEIEKVYSEAGKRLFDNFLNLCCKRKVASLHPQ